MLVGIGSVYMTLTARRRAVLPCSSLLASLPLLSFSHPVQVQALGVSLGFVERWQLAGAAPGGLAVSVVVLG